MRRPINWLRQLPIDTHDIMGMAGFGSLIYGVSLWSSAAAWVTAGVLILAAWSAPIVTKSKGA